MARIQKREDAAPMAIVVFGDYGCQAIDQINVKNLPGINSIAIGEESNAFESCNAMMKIPVKDSVNQYFKLQEIFPTIWTDNYIVFVVGDFENLAFHKFVNSIIIENVHVIDNVIFFVKDNNIVCNKLSHFSKFFSEYPVVFMEDKNFNFFNNFNSIYGSINGKGRHLNCVDVADIKFIMKKTGFSVPIHFIENQKNSSRSEIAFLDFVKSKNIDLLKVKKAIFHFIINSGYDLEKFFRLQNSILELFGEECIYCYDILLKDGDSELEIYSILFGVETECTSGCENQ